MRAAFTGTPAMTVEARHQGGHDDALAGTALARRSSSDGLVHGSG